MAEMDEETREALKSALWYSIGKIVDEESLRHGVNATPQFIGALTELVWSQCESLQTDLSTFATHANRALITVPDVLLVARRNAALEGLLRDFVDREEERAVREGGRGASNGRGRGVGNGKAKGKGKARG